MCELFVPRAKHARVRVFLAALTIAILVSASPRLSATSIFFSGNLRTDATVTDCGPSCSLGAFDSDADYAQFAAVVDSFNVASTSTMTAITYSYGGRMTSIRGGVGAGGLEPYLSLFDSGGNFLASTYFGTTCPAGAHTYDGNCYDVLLDGGTLAAGSYYIALTAYANMSFAENYGAGNLSDGFTGLGGLAADEDLHYDYEVILTSTAPVPEPNFTFLVGIAMAAPILLRGMKLRARMRA